jgi:hypothetical protein
MSSLIVTLVDAGFRVHCDVGPEASLSVFVARRLPGKEFHGGSTENISQTVRGSRLFFPATAGR